MALSNLIPLLFLFPTIRPAILLLRTLGKCINYALVKKLNQCKTNQAIISTKKIVEIVLKPI